MQRKTLGWLTVILGAGMLWSWTVSYLRYEFESDRALRVGAECVDGTFSDATGSGTCSSHGGVDAFIVDKDGMLQPSFLAPAVDYGGIGDLFAPWWLWTVAFGVAAWRWLFTPDPGGETILRTREEARAAERDANATRSPNEPNHPDSSTSAPSPVSTYRPPSPAPTPTGKLTRSAGPARMPAPTPAVAVEIWANRMRATSYLERDRLRELAARAADDGVRVDLEAHAGFTTATLTHPSAGSITAEPVRKYRSQLFANGPHHGPIAAFLDDLRRWHRAIASRDEAAELAVLHGVRIVAEVEDESILLIITDGADVGTACFDASYMFSEDDDDLESRFETYLYEAERKKVAKQRAAAREPRSNEGSVSQRVTSSTDLFDDDGEDDDDDEFFWEPTP